MNISYNYWPHICTPTDSMNNFNFIFINILPESIPCQKQILQEPVDVQVKALNPSQTATKENVLVQNEYKPVKLHVKGLNIISE